MYFVILNYLDNLTLCCVTCAVSCSKIVVWKCDLHLIRLWSWVIFEMLFFILRIVCCFFFCSCFVGAKTPVVISRTYPWSLNRIVNGVYFNLYLFSTIWEHLAQYSTTTGMPHLFWCNDVLPDVHWRAALSLVLWHWRTNWSYWTAR